jgi:hypothetical protein
METLKLGLMLVLCVSLEWVSAGNPVQINQQQTQEVAMNYSAKRSLFLNTTPDKQYKEFDQCRMFKRKQIAGFLILPIGLGAIAGGTYMTYVGGRNIANSFSTSDIYSPTSIGSGVQKRDEVMVGVGAATILVGMVLAPTGLVMGLHNSVQRHRYCREEKTFYIMPSKSGMGLACQF